MKAFCVNNRRSRAERDLGLAQERIENLERLLILEQEQKEKQSVEARNTTVTSFAKRVADGHYSQGWQQAEPEQLFGKREAEWARQKANLATLSRTRESHIKDLEGQVYGLRQTVASLQSRAETETQGMRNEIERLSQMNKEKDERIKASEIEINARTDERNQAIEQYEYINEQFLLGSENWRPTIERLEDLAMQKENTIQESQKEVAILRRELQRVAAFSSHKDRNFRELRDESIRLVAELRAEIKEKEQNLDNMEAAAQALISWKDEATLGLRQRSKLLAKAEILSGKQKERDLYYEDIFVSGEC